MKQKSISHLNSALQREYIVILNKLNIWYTLLLHLHYI